MFSALEMTSLINKSEHLGIRALRNDLKQKLEINYKTGKANIFCLRWKIRVMSYEYIRLSSMHYPLSLNNLSPKNLKKYFK